MLTLSTSADIYIASFTRFYVSNHSTSLETMETDPSPANKTSVHLQWKNIKERCHLTCQLGALTELSSSYLSIPPEHVDQMKPKGLDPIPTKSR